MRIPERLSSLAEQGIIEEVVRPLMSGKEAEVFLIVSGGELRVAKVYKEAQDRTFKNRAQYTEGRKVRNSRDQRAIDKRSRHGRAQDEASWRSTEVDMIYRLSAAGVRVPTPHHFVDGVFIMELVTDADGNPAPRLGELRFSPEEATKIFDHLLTEVVRMLCAGVVHGDLSDFNVLMSADGPVVIDFPQAVDASSNQNARKLLLRDVDNLHRFLSRFAPNRARRSHAHEMWDLYASSELTPETRLTGQHRASTKRADTDAVLELIGDANYDERRRREQNGLSMRGVADSQQRRSEAGGPQQQRRSEVGAPQQHRSEAAGPQPRRVEVVIAPRRPEAGAPQPRRVEVVVAPSAPRGRSRSKRARA